MFLEKYIQLTKLYSAHSASEVDEKWLFHGTSASALKSICEQNFDWRRTGENVGHIYGHGVYFASAASASNTYAEFDCDTQSKFMLVANVLVGLICEGASDMKYLPMWKDTVQYDTSVNNVMSPSIFVKYHDNEYYPIYVIQYK
jgi:hypothetical protein